MGEKKYTRLFQGDPVIWVIFFALCGISLIEVFSATSMLTYKSGDYLRPISGHAAMLGAGFLLMMVVQFMPSRIYRILVMIFYPLSILTLLLMLAGVGVQINGASRWISIAGIHIQPSEFGKGSVIVSEAILISQYLNGVISAKTTFKWIMIMGGLVCALILPENFSTAALLLADILAVMIVGKIPLKYIGTTLGVMAIVGATGFFVLPGMSDSTAASISKLPGCKRVATWRARLETKVSETTKTVNPDDFDIDENSQIGHSSIAIATSNIIGKGPGHSVQRDFLPQAYSDFIYSVIVEEWGLIGAVFVVMLYLILLVRVGYITKRFRNSTFEPILAMGLAILLVSQAMLNMMVATGLFPVTGQPLPLISRGGTSTIVNCVYMGMILSVSRISKREAASAAKAAARKAAAAAVPAGDAGDAAVPDTNEEIPPAEVTAREIAAADFGDEDEKEST